MTLPIDPTSPPPATPTKILVATDLTDTEYLLPHAIAQAKASGASLLLIHSVLPHESMPVETGAIPYYDPLRMDRDARLLLESLARDVRNQGVECTAVVRHGFVPDVVAEVVQATGAGRLILGTHGRRGLKKFVLGSVARQLLETMDVPVCTIGPRAHIRGASTGLILHPVSLAGLHRPSAALSLSLAEQFGTEAMLLHILLPSPAVARDPLRAVAAATEELDQLVPGQVRARARVVVKIAAGSVVQEILAAAQEHQPGLIVLGVHAPAHSWLPGTEPAAYKILVSAPCPVISLRVNPAIGVEKEEHREGHREEHSPLLIG